MRNLNENEILLIIVSLIIFTIVELYSMGVNNTFMAFVFVFLFYYLIKFFIKQNDK